MYVITARVTENKTTRERTFVARGALTTVALFVDDIVSQLLASKDSIAVTRLIFSLRCRLYR